MTCKKFLEECDWSNNVESKYCEVMKSLQKMKSKMKEKNRINQKLHVVQGNHLELTLTSSLWQGKCCWVLSWTKLLLKIHLFHWIFSDDSTDSEDWNDEWDAFLSLHNLKCSIGRRGRRRVKFFCRWGALSLLRTFLLLLIAHDDDPDGNGYDECPTQKQSTVFPRKPWFHYFRKRS